MEQSFEKDVIPAYDYADLDGKTLEIKVHEGDEAIVVSGKDVQSGKIYVILVKVK